jgi:ABC-type uncharacterized transport system involved in gliding motility auxiliary subunit
MKINARFRLQVLVQNSLFVVLLIAIVASILYLTRDVNRQWDLTQGKNNTLSQASLDVLDEVSGPITITAFATTRDAEGNLRQEIQDFIAPYQRAKKDVSLTFVDPREDPGRATKAGVRLNGELVVEVNNRSENLATATEQAFTNLLVRLMRSSEQLIVALDGHGEGRLNKPANFDLGEIGARLEAQGFRTGSVNFAVAQDVPDNASVLVIASPRVDLLAGEVNRIKRYLEKGGNLLWLVDYESLRGMEPVADFLGLDLLDGVVIDPAAGSQNLPPTISLAYAYAEHVVTNRMNATNTVYPFARRIAAHEDTSFHFTPLVEVASDGWLETSGLMNAQLDRDSDIRGPITVSAALERDVGDSQQRIVVMGSGRGLTNEYVGMLGNMDLGINIMNWLAGEDSLIIIQPKSRIDLTLDLSQGALTAISLGFLIFLPLGLLVAGGLIWWKRRKS